MKKVFVANDPTQAHMVAGILEDHGIRTCIQGEALWGARGELPLTPDSAPSVWVTDEADAARAAELIREHDRPVNPKHCLGCGYNLRGVLEPRCPECGRPFHKEVARKCPACGEVIEGQFTHCWKCGAAVDAAE